MKKNNYIAKAYEPYHKETQCSFLITEGAGASAKMLYVSFNKATPQKTPTNMTKFSGGGGGANRLMYR